MAERDRREARGDKRSRRPGGHEHSHPGGTGAVLGTHLARFSSAQGLTLLITNLIHYASIPVVARFLGVESLGTYALLFFLTAMVTQVIHLASKPGTIMRTFGVGDDDDDADDDRGRGGALDPSHLHGRRGARLVRVPGCRRHRARVRLPNPGGGVPPQRPRPGQRGPVRDHHRGGLGDLQARRDGHLVREAAPGLRAHGRLAPHLQPDRDRRRARLRRRGGGSGGRTGGRHHAGDRALHRAPARQLPARLQLRRALGDPQARLELAFRSPPRCG